MGKISARIRPLAAAVLFFFAACGKKDNGESPEPTLSAPNAPERVPAQAEVKASSGPIELSLLLHKTQIKPGESLWHQLRIRNIGQKEITIVDQVFRDPWQLRQSSKAGYGIYIEARGPDGKALKIQFHKSAGVESDIADEPSGLLEVAGPNERAMLDGWRKQGLNQYEIDMKLIDFNTKKKRAAQAEQRVPVIKLLPAQSTETKTSQLDFLKLDEPGKYEIRAVYDRAPTPETNRMRGKLPLYSEEVLVRTPWIQVTVLR